MNTDRAHLLRYLEGALPEAEEAALRHRLEQDAELRRRLRHLETLATHLEASAPRSFAPYFSQRVLHRLQPAAAPGEALYDVLKVFFARTAFATASLAAVLATYNILDFQDLGVTSTLFEALFGLPSTSIMDALSYGLM